MFPAVAYSANSTEGPYKDVIMEYSVPGSGVDSGGVFYTDANGRQFMRRVRTGGRIREPVSPNYYPVTSGT